MNRIIFDNVTPDVFSSSGNLHSDIWQTVASFEKGKTYLIEAESGKGKSTFCSYILGYRNDYSGIVRFDDQDTKTFKSSQWAEIRRNHVSHLFQELRLFPELTALENVMIKNQLTNHTTLDQVASWFERLGIPEKMDSKIGKMSFGQQQRVAMMRALSQPFDFLLVDEPISHLDDGNSAIMADIMLSEAKKQNACVIVTSIGKHMDINYDVTYKL